MAMLRAKVEGGILEGLPAGNQKFSVFRGVPFAAPPVGKLRWKDPQPVPHWEGVRPAYKFAPIAMQMPFASEGGGIAATDFYVGTRNTSEDCLYLNIWTPAESADEKLPVAVYIHGGGHQTGYSYLNCYDGEGFCKRGIIMVSIAYRLNAFGYLVHPELIAEAKNEGCCAGNFGVKDQLAALKWVKNNIAAFGGDPECVTLFGQSGGASSVSNMCALPASKGLFQRAIMQSGGGIRNVYSYWAASLEKASEVGTAFFKELGVSTVEQARKLSAQEVLDTYNRFVHTPLVPDEPPALGNMGFMRFSPVDDGVLFPERVTDLYRSGKYPELDYLLGSTADEMPETTHQNMAFAEVNAGFGKKPCYLYYFTYVPPEAPNAHHSVEHHYVFQTLMRSVRPYTGKDYDLSNKLADYWANFMKTGNPNGKDANEWKPYVAGEYNALEIAGDTFNMISLKNCEDVIKASHKLATGQ